MAWPCLGEPAHVALCDVDTGEPTDGRKIRNLAVSEITTPEGRGLKMQSAGRGYVARRVAMTDWRRFEAFTMQMNVESGPIRMRVRAMRGENPAGLLCRFTLEPGDWRPLVLPLKDWRNDTGDQVCDFSKVKTLMIVWDAGEGAASLDSIRLVPGQRGNQRCQPTHEDRLALAFAGGGGKAAEGKHFVIYTDARELKTKRLLERLGKGYALLRRQFRLPGEMRRRPRSSSSSGATRTSRSSSDTANTTGSWIGAPKADGHSALGIAAGVLDEQNYKRPSLLHEAMHAAIYQHLYVANKTPLRREQNTSTSRTT